MKKLLLISINVFLLMMCITVQQATAQQNCQGASCDGLVPAQTVCFSDSQSIGYYLIKDWNQMSVGHVEYRYSPYCETVWSEVVAYYPTTVITAGFDSPYPYPSGDTYSVTLYGLPYPDPGVTYVTSKMNHADINERSLISATGSFTSRIASIFNCHEPNPNDCTPIENSFWGSASYNSFIYW